MTELGKPWQNSRTKGWPESEEDEMQRSHSSSTLLRPRSSLSAADSLAIVGAGPKALAITGKAAAARSLGCEVPPIEVWDQHGVSAHWTGGHGYTDGHQVLGTLPEKDIGFPYKLGLWSRLRPDSRFDLALHQQMQQYSWQAYMIAQGQWSEWIDAGRPQPEHRHLAAYLRWVAQKVAATPGIRFGIGKVTSISIHDGRWDLRIQDEETGSTLRRPAGGLVITGPGEACRIPGQPLSHPRVFDGKTYWQVQNPFVGLTGQIRVGVVGAGETAASTVVRTLSLLGNDALIDIISPHGVTYSRGECYHENRLFSCPDPDWKSLSNQDRREFIQRTDRGVFSLQAMAALQRSTHVRPVAGKAIAMDAQSHSIYLDIHYGSRTERHAYDVVVVATSFDPLWFLSLFDDVAQAELSKSLGFDLTSTAVRKKARELIAERIGDDLAIEDLTPRLHLPMLSGFRQGPGFANLSCLGLLADRILLPYVERD